MKVSIFLLSLSLLLFQSTVVGMSGVGHEHAGDESVVNESAGGHVSGGREMMHDMIHEKTHGISGAGTHECCEETNGLKTDCGNEGSCCPCSACPVPGAAISTRVQTPAPAISAAGGCRFPSSSLRTASAVIWRPPITL